MTPTVCCDRALLDAWHPVAAIVDLQRASPQRSQLLGQSLTCGLDPSGDPWVRDANGRPAPTLVRYGYLWSSIGLPPDDLFVIPECAEPDRRSIHAGTIGIAASAPRAVENFLDMGHFPYVHGGLLGQAPRTEVADYHVEIDPVTNDIYARNCVFYQPVAAAHTTGGQMSAYTYRVPHPHCVMLYKTCPSDPHRLDVIALFLQATSADTVRAHAFLSLIDHDSTDTQIIAFQQHILAQDKPILENQRPRRLPLDPRAETPIRADRVAITYRRWLSDLGVTYSAIPVTA